MKDRGSTVVRLLALLAFLLPTAFLALAFEKFLSTLAGRGVLALAQGEELGGFTVCLFKAGPGSDPLVDRASRAAVILIGISFLAAARWPRKGSLFGLGFTVFAAVSLLGGAAPWFVESVDGGAAGIGWPAFPLLVAVTFIINFFLLESLEAWLGADDKSMALRRILTVIIGALGGLAWWIPGLLREGAHDFPRIYGALIHFGSTSLLLLRAPPLNQPVMTLKAAVVPSVLSWGALLAVLAVCVVPALPFWAPMPSLPAVPSPNGSDALTEAGSRCEWDHRFVHEEPTLEDLRRTVEQNASAVEDARKALGLECRVSLRIGEDGELLLGTGGAVDLNKLRHAFAAASRVAAGEGDLGRAAELAVDMVRLGVKAQRGGLLINWVISCSLQTSGLEEVHRQARGLDLSSAEHSLTALIELADRRERLEEAMVMEKLFFPASQAWSRRQALRCGCISFGSIAPPFPIEYPEMERKLLLRWRLALTELSIRVHEARTGRLPESLDAVAPAIPAWILEDPYASNGGRIIYRPDAVRYALYSVGPNHQDDGGPEQPDLDEDAPGSDDISLDG
jgi:hypothetical protein